MTTTAGDYVIMFLKNKFEETNKIVSIEAAKKALTIIFNNTDFEDIPKLNKKQDGFEDYLESQLHQIADMVDECMNRIPDNKYDLTRRILGKRFNF